MYGRFFHSTVMCLPDAANLMVGVVEAKDLGHALDFEPSHDAEAMVDVDEVHVHVKFELMAPTAVAKVSTVLLDTET